MELMTLNDKHKFKFPLYRTGGFFNNYLFLKGKVHFNKRLAGVDIDTKTIVFSDGRRINMII